MDDELLTAYLQDHWMGATAGAAMFRRVARTHGDAQAAVVVRRLAAEIAEDRESLRAIMAAVGARPPRVGAVVARVGEAAGRLKPNGHLFTRPPVTDVIELEALRIAVHGKAAGWHVLGSLADCDPRLDRALLGRLRARAEDQIGRLTKEHIRVARLRAVGVEDPADTQPHA